MNVACLFDLAKGAGPLTVTLVAEEKLPKALKSEIEGILRNTATLVSSQGLSPGRDDAVLNVLSLVFSADGRTAVAELEAVSVPAAAWRVLIGLLSAFDTMAATIDEVRIEQPGYAGKTYSEADLFAQSYPGTDPKPGFALTHEQSPSNDAAVEVTLVKDVSKELRDSIEAAMNAWLQTAEGGFFEDGDEPVSNAHDCPKVKRSGNRLLVARMDAWEGDEGAFRAVINQMAHFQRLHGCIESVSVE